LRGRRPRNNQIFQIIKIKNKKKWSKEEDTLLIKLAEKYKEKHWKEISKNFSNKNALQCFSRYKRIRPGIVKGSWSKEEDDRILRLVEQYGKAWSKISKILVTRNGKQIRDRFINVLDPEIKKGKFTDEEDRALMKFYMYYGPRWATIAKHFPNRTADMIKNRFHSSIKKLFFGNQAKPSKGMNQLREKYNLILQETYNEQYDPQSDDIQEQDFEQEQQEYQNFVKEQDYPMNNQVNNCNNLTQNTHCEISTGQFTNITNTISLSFPNSKGETPSDKSPKENDSHVQIKNEQHCNNYPNYYANHSNYNIHDQYKLENEDYITSAIHNNNANNIYNNYDMLNIKDSEEDFQYSDDNMPNLFNFEEYFSIN
jgi:hypothetical protein